MPEPVLPLCVMRSNSLSIELLGALLAGQHYGFQTEAQGFDIFDFPTY